MKRFYYYLISSLPMLEFDRKASISYKVFFERCREQLCPDDMRIIERAVLGPFISIDDEFPMLKAWKRFEIALRNELARHRAIKLSRDPVKYLRGEYYIDPFISPLAQWAVSQEGGSILDVELYIDKVRWDKIEELTRFHYFDLVYLVGYALKLQLLERWDRIKNVDGMNLLEDLINK